MLSKLQRGKCNDFRKEIKALKPKKESLPLTVGGTPGKSSIANLLLLLLLLKKVGSARLRESGVHIISPMTPAPQTYRQKEEKGKKSRRL